MTQQDARRPVRLWFRGRARLAALVTLAAGGVTIAAAQAVAPPSLSGSWTLEESTGDLPDRAVRAFDGSAVSTATIDVQQADGSVTVRRIAPHAVLLRVMLLQAGERDSEAIPGAVLTARAQWQDRTLVARGDVIIKQGFLKRRVPYEEEWRVDEGTQTLTVVLSVKTPLGVKRRTQVFVRGNAQKIWSRSEFTFTNRIAWEDDVIGESI